jgi:succinate-acetate transporter protein
VAHDTYQGDGTTGDGELSAPAPAQAVARAELAGRLNDITRINLRPMGSPMPIGFIGLAGATLVLAAMNLGWIPPSEAHTVAIVMIAFTFPLQAAASIFGMLTRDGVAATGMGVLAGTWLTTGIVMATSPPGSTSDALGVLLLVAATAMLLPAIGASFGKLVPAAVLSVAALRFASSGVYQLNGSTAWEQITGWTGMVLGILALYAALAALVENARGRTVLPLGRRQNGKMAAEGGFAEQVVDVTHEPGVRAQL